MAASVSDVCTGRPERCAGPAVGCDETDEHASSAVCERPLPRRIDPTQLARPPRGDEAKKERREREASRSCQCVNSGGVQTARRRTTRSIALSRGPGCGDPPVE